MNIIFMGTPDFAVPCLQTLLDSSHTVQAVFTQPDRPKGRGKQLSSPPVKVLAEKYEIPVLQPLKVKDPEYIQKIKDLKPDLIVVVAYGQILSKEILEIPPYGCVNVHASLLPKYRGAAPIQGAIIEGETQTGVTTMYMDVGLDTGDMILKKAIDIDEADTGGSLHDNLSLLGAEILRDTLICIENNTAPREKQNDNFSTYAPLLKKSMGLIDWEQPAKKIHNLIRGLSPWPSAYTNYQGNIMKIWTTKVAGDDSSMGEQKTPGKIVNLTEEGIWVQTGKDLLIIQEVQLQGKRRMPSQEFLRGNTLQVGDILGGSQNGSAK